VNPKYKVIFDFVPGLYPLIHRTLVDSGLDGPSFFVLSYTRRFGADTSQGRGVMIGHLEKIYSQSFNLDISTGAKHIIKLQDEKKYLQKTFIPQEECARLFKNRDPRAQSVIVVITDKGQAKLEEVNARTEQFIEDLIKESNFLDRKLIDGSLTMLAMMMPALNARVERLRLGDSGPRPASGSTSAPAEGNEN
jgi:DNA-binding MarR family transcriptional regulator